MTTPACPTLLVNATLVDPVDGEIRTDQGLLITAVGKVGAVGGSDDVRSEAGRQVRPVDLGGAVVCPGLINMHVHFSLALPGHLQVQIQGLDQAGLAYRMADAARRTLQAGVTTVRLVGEKGGVDFALRAAIAAGQVPGPRIYTAGEALCCTGGHGWSSDACEADGADGFRRAARLQIRGGADLVKVCISGGIAGEHEEIHTPQLTDDEMRAVCDVAHDWGRKVAAHAGPAEPIRRAVEMGLDCVEHGYEMTRELTDLMAERGTWYVPTITVSRCEQFFRDHGVPDWMRERALGAGPRHWESLQHAITSGVRIAMGTDMPPHAPYDETTATVREMEFMEEAGMPAAAVLASATVDAAEWLGAEDEIGRLRAGARADFIVLDHNPLAGIGALRGLHAVVHDGRVYRDDRHLLGADRWGSEPR